jgi:cytochrome c5
LITAVIFLLARLVSVFAGYVPDDGSRFQAAAEERIMPVGRVVLVGDPEAPKVAEAGSLSADQIVAQNCAACHQAGVLGAPKIGSKEDWEPRFVKGLDTLVSSAINGLNQMPARGGNPNLSDDDIRNSLIAMLTESGIDAGESAAPDSPTEGTSDAASGDTSAESPPEASADSGTETGSSEEQTKENVADVAQGKELYPQACAACHDTGAANAPKLGDQAAWADRINQGMDTLVGHAVNGFNAMPPKGGAMQLSDEQIAAIVVYMVESSK